MHFVVVTVSYGSRQWYKPPWLSAEDQNPPLTVTGRGYRSGYRTYKPLISVAPTGNKLVPSLTLTLDIANVTLPINRRRSSTSVR